MTLYKMDLNQYNKMDYFRDIIKKKHDNTGLPQCQLTQHKNFCLVTAL